MALVDASKAESNRCCVVREGRATYVRRAHLTAAELADVGERESSLLARMRFAVATPGVGGAEDGPVKPAPGANPTPKGE
jgi:hypothetical protein